MKKLVIIFLCLVVTFLLTRLFVGEGGLTELAAQQERLERLERENRRLYQRNQLLVREVVELQQGMETIEESARQELGMIRRDETFFLTYD